MIAQCSNSKLETVLYTYMQQRKKIEEKEKELNCWNHSVLEQLKREIATNKLHLNILLDFASKPIIQKETK